MRPTLTIYCDTREQLPYDFKIAATVFKVNTVRMTIPEGDYLVTREPRNGTLVIRAHECAVVERKTLADLYSTIGQHRERFAKEQERLRSYGYAAIVIEAELSSILKPNDQLSYTTKLSPKSVFASLLAWSQRYNTHLFMTPDRQVAEMVTFRILERWIKDKQRQ